MHKKLHVSAKYLILLVIGCVFFLHGCGRQDSALAQETPEIKRPTIKIGLIPEQNLFEQKKRYAPLFDYLSAELGVIFESHILSRYGNIVDYFNELGLDGAFMGSFTGALAIQKLGVEPLVRPQHVNGTSTYFGLVFARKGSGLGSAESLRGKRMVFVDRATTAGYLLPLAYFKKIGISDYENWFDKFYFSGTHEDAIMDVLNGLADVGAAKNTVYENLVLKDLNHMDKLEILATSPPVPSNALLVKSTFPADFKILLRNKLLTMDQSAAGRKALAEINSTKFIETTVADYQPVLDYATSIGINLAEYDYRNQ